MKLAVDCRMSGKSGIGAFIDGILPFFIASGTSLLLLVPESGLYGEELRAAAAAAQQVRILTCPQKVFSLQELLCFPRALVRNNWYKSVYIPNISTAATTTKTTKSA